MLIQGRQRAFFFDLRHSNDVNAFAEGFFASLSIEIFAEFNTRHHSLPMLRSRSLISSNDQASLAGRWLGLRRQLGRWS